ncbi:lycopene cyclase family protein [Rhodococcus sp. HNM0563]|uniref:lycopene cyclase family protein n=1 Tax=unclassified Rhodococcus (in: high G+C Gram-positive bacteria) TaxID=192944 RepID=UPI00146EB9B4|nr:lycopene cyclase family protein [Rhodococcus sp. F64268]MCK0093162.1 lycopene cyclase family protein [Rhodococcus sp. F64268]NLU65142.1 lycopene cyclase family protein [Rhodococcus sp. HNM0563]
MTADVLVAGLGPSGRALAARCAEAGLSVRAVDPSPHRPWTATYGAWADELPSWLPDDVLATRIESPGVWTTHPRVLDRPYVVLDTAALQQSLSLESVAVTQASVRSVGPGEVVLDDGKRLRAAHVFDARGLPAPPACAQQTAFGVVTDARVAAPALEGHSAWFMDWRQDNGTSDADTPSFLYAVPLGDEQVLLEETCLVGRPALPLAELQRRLTTRLAARDVEVAATAAVERVRFSVEGGARRHAGTLGFGACGGLMHPATGYAVAAALTAADPVASAIRSGADPYRSLWPRSARTVAALRTLGLRVLLGLHPAEVPEFFAAFFDLPPDRQRAYLSGRTDVLGTLDGMRRLFAAVPWGVRGSIMRAIL